MRVVRALLLLILFAVLLGFAVYNAEERVAVNILQTRYINVPLILVAYWGFIFGMVVAFLLFVMTYIKHASEVRRFKRLTDSLHNEIAALRNRPIEEQTGDFLLSDKDKRT
jgi:uncharacterized integral membrane protein